MKQWRVLSIVWLLQFILISMPAQKTYKIQDPEKHFTKKERQTFENAVNYEALFYNRIFADKYVDFSDMKFTVIPDQISYAYYIEKAGASSHLNSPGIYFPLREELVVCASKKFRESFIRISCHELSHAFMDIHSELRYVPAWLNEGLAVYLQSMTYDKKQVKHVTDHRYVARVLTLIELKDLNLRDFVNWDYKRFSSESFSQEGYGYAVGYCTVAFLMRHDEEQAIQLFRHLVGYQTTEEIFDQYYTGGFRQFEEDFLKYWKKYMVKC